MIKKYHAIRTFLILLILLGSFYACATRPQERSLREPDTTAGQNLTMKKSGPPAPSLTLPRGDERVATFFQEKLRDPAGKKDACKEYILTFTQDKVLWNWARQNC